MKAIKLPARRMTFEKTIRAVQLKPPCRQAARKKATARTTCGPISARSGLSFHQTKPAILGSVLSAQHWSRAHLRDWKDGKGTNTLGAVDKNPLDVCGGRRARVKAGIFSQAKFRPAIGMMNVDNNIFGIEQYNKVLCQISQRVHVQIQIAK